jgi:drug/metabolite transporter (DMT)-like permease
MPISLSALLLIVGASLCWSGLDTMRKLLASRLHPIPLVILLTLGQVPLFLIWLLYDGNFQIAPGYFLPGLAAVALNITANLMFVHALKLSPFSLTIPFLSLTPVFVMLLAMVFLGEYPTRLQAAGILVAVMGALGLNLARNQEVNLENIWQALRGERGSLLMIGVAILWSINSSLDKLAVARASVAFHALVQVTGMAVGLLAFLALKSRQNELLAARPHWLFLLGAILFCAGGLALELTVIQTIPLRFVAIIKRVLELSLAVMIGRRVFEETITARKLAAIGLMGIGIVIVLTQN